MSQGDIEECSIDELEEIGKKIGMGFFHLKRFKKLKSQVNK